MKQKLLEASKALTSKRFTAGQLLAFMCDYKLQNCSLASNTSEEVSESKHKGGDINSTGGAGKDFLSGGKDGGNSSSSLLGLVRGLVLFGN